MAQQLLNRREFLRLSLVLTGSALVAACQKVPIRTTPTPVKGTMTPELKAGIQLNGGDADAWIHNKLVRGSLENPEVCQDVSIDNGGARVGAVLKGQSFFAEVAIRPGSNPLTAICRHADEQEEVSPEITIDRQRKRLNFRHSPR